ncbi:MAG: DNA helicase, partial [Pseudomonadota bacterium]|nr:DNA helicase [Pseudomonadota bacterium]
MDFLIADTFLEGLARLTGDEQKLVKTTVFDLQVNPVNPGHQMHKLDRARDRNFWSVRVGSDIRLIVHKTAGSLLVCYVDHHDKAYAWAERRRMEVHPKTGAAQIVEVRETVKEIVIPRHVEAPPQEPTARRLFEDLTDDALLGIGVPPDWLGDVRLAD